MSTCQSRAEGQGVLTPLATEEELRAVSNLLARGCCSRGGWSDEVFSVGLTTLGQKRALGFLDRPRPGSSTALLRSAAAPGQGFVNGSWPDDISVTGTTTGAASDVPAQPLCGAVRLLLSTPAAESAAGGTSAPGAATQPQSAAACGVTTARNLICSGEVRHQLEINFHACDGGPRVQGIDDGSSAAHAFVCRVPLAPPKPPPIPPPAPVPPRLLGVYQGLATPPLEEPAEWPPETEAAHQPPPPPAPGQAASSPAPVQPPHTRGPPPSAPASKRPPAPVSLAAPAPASPSPTATPPPPAVTLTPAGTPASPAAAAVRSKCDSAVLDVGGPAGGATRYLACHATASWAEAAELCAGLVPGGRLAVFESQAQMDAVYGVISAKDLGGSYDFWFGLASGASWGNWGTPPPLEYILTDPRVIPTFPSQLWSSGALGVHRSCKADMEPPSPPLPPSPPSPPAPPPPPPPQSPSSPPQPPSPPVPPPQPPSSPAPPPTPPRPSPTPVSTSPPPSRLPARSKRPPSPGPRPPSPLPASPTPSAAGGSTSQPLPSPGPGLQPPAPPLAPSPALPAPPNVRILSPDAIFTLGTGPQPPSHLGTQPPAPPAVASPPRPVLGPPPRAAAPLDMPRPDGCCASLTILPPGANYSNGGGGPSLRACYQKLKFICQAPTGADGGSPTPGSVGAGGGAGGATTLIAGLFLDALEPSYRGAFRVFQAQLELRLVGAPFGPLAGGDGDPEVEGFRNETARQLSAATQLPAWSFAVLGLRSGSVVADVNLTVRGLPRATLANFSEFVSTSMVVGRQPLDLFSADFIRDWGVQEVVVTIVSLSELSEPPSPPAPEARSNRLLILVIALVVGGALLSAAALVLVLLVRRRQRLAAGATVYLSPLPLDDDDLVPRKAPTGLLTSPPPGTPSTASRLQLSSPPLEPPDAFYNPLSARSSKLLTPTSSLRRIQAAQLQQQLQGSLRGSHSGPLGDGGWVTRQVSRSVSRSVIGTEAEAEARSPGGGGGGGGESLYGYAAAAAGGGGTASSGKAASALTPSRSGRMTGVGVTSLRGRLRPAALDLMALGLSPAAATAGASSSTLSYNDTSMPNSPSMTWSASRLGRSEPIPSSSTVPPSRAMFQSGFVLREHGPRCLGQAYAAASPAALTRLPAWCRPEHDNTVIHCILQHFYI